MPDFPIVDTHVHLYDPESVRYSWLKDVPKLNSLHSSAEYNAALAGIVVDKLVFVEVDADPGQNRDEIRWITELARRDPRIQGIVGSFALETGKAVEAEIAAFAANPLARNVRRLIQGHVSEPGWCLRSTFLDGVRVVGEYGLGFEICILHPQMKDAIQLVEKFPDLRFVLDHIGKPGIRDGLVEPWKSDMAALAVHPNVHVKISGVATEADHQAWTYDQVAPYVDWTIEVFGFDRVMFGGDWPVLELAGTYAQWLSVVERIVAGSPAADLRKLFRDNAIQHYRL